MLRMRRLVTWAVAITPALLLAAGAISREPQPPVRGPYSLIDSVSAARLEADVLRLAMRPDGTPRSRYTSRAEFESEAIAFCDSVLRANLSPADTVFLHRWRWITGGDTLWPPNLVGVHRGSRPGLGGYILCAHLDATAAHSTGWNRHADPAPGADDNASGSAVVLEAARVLGRESFDFDLYFVLFSGEEQGLLGSLALADSLAEARTPLHGVFNFDMIAYRKPGDPLEIEGMPNRLSQWMTDLLARRQAELGEGATGIRFTPTRPQSLQNSDQASFWRYGYDAMLLIETVDAVAYNPNYHKVTDRPDAYGEGLRYDQAAGILKLVVGALDGFRAAPQGLADFTVHPDQITFTAGGQRLENPVVDAGVPVLISGAALSQGATRAAGTTRFFFRSGSRLLPDGERLRVGFRGAGAVLRDTLVWIPGEGDIGLHVINVTVDDPDLEESDLADNTATDTLLVRGSRMLVLQHFVYPNPISLSAAGLASLGQAHLRLVVGRPGSASVEIFDLSGRRIGRTREDVLVTGAYADLPLSAIVEGDRLAAGIYFYRVRVRGADGEAAASGRFALLR